MKSRNRKFIITDTILIILMILPVAAGIVLKILTNPLSQGIEISGAKIYFTVEMPVQPLFITESQVNSLIVLLSVFFLSLYLPNGIPAKGGSRRQVFAEMIVEKTENLVKTNMGDYFHGFAPFIAAIMALSAFSSLLTLVGLYPPTSDINIVGGWAILVFILITHYKMKCGPIYYVRSFTQPVPFLTPLNVISEIATPVSMAFRHYGNILSGSVISVLVAFGLQNLSNMIFKNLPGFLGSIPFLRVGIPAVLSVYFDLFSGCLQAFIFAMLTMLYIATGFPAQDYEKRRKTKLAKNN